MKHGRPWIDQAVDDKFGSSWWKWWKCLRPCEYMPADNAEELDWEGVNKAGSNGVLLIVVVLAWWGSTGSEDLKSPGPEGWKVVLGEVSWVLERLRDIQPVEKPAQAGKKYIFHQDSTDYHTDQLVVMVDAKVPRAHGLTSRLQRKGMSCLAETRSAN
jgi:hypothetical protein